MLVARNDMTVVGVGSSCDSTRGALLTFALWVCRRLLEAAFRMFRCFFPNRVAGRTLTFRRWPEGQHYPKNHAPAHFFSRLENRARTVYRLAGQKQREADWPRAGIWRCVWVTPTTVTESDWRLFETPAPVPRCIVRRDNRAQSRMRPA